MSIFINARGSSLLFIAIFVSLDVLLERRPKKKKNVREFAASGLVVDQKPQTKGFRHVQTVKEVAFHDAAKNEPDVEDCRQKISWFLHET